MSESLRILAIFAHPDDEIASGGTLARYAAQGADITLVCATRGEAATIYCDDCATPETLAQVRTRELACACDALGIAHLLWLDWPDGGVPAIGDSRALEQLVPIIRQVRPHIILTHPEHGNYPHPDHIAVHGYVVAAFHAAAEADMLPQHGPAWRTPKLYVRAIPRQVFELIPGFENYRVQLNGASLPFVADPPEHIHCQIDCKDFVEQRIRAWQCHRSQHNPNGTFSTLTPEQQKRIFHTEYFRLLAHHLPSEPAPHTTLTAGLNQQYDA